MQIYDLTNMCLIELLTTQVVTGAWFLPVGQFNSGMDDVCHLAKAILVTKNLSLIILVYNRINMYFIIRKKLQILSVYV